MSCNMSRQSYGHWFSILCLGVWSGILGSSWLLICLSLKYGYLGLAVNSLIGQNHQQFENGMLF